ncbi:MAG TPA: ATP-dependent zinc metalloprotease FtsH [Candidatus Saccharimonadales bacterium]|jgi:cell division protease FtsH|nr:ATP-dependent zinc metalloprotease FtsH [Candidatus Saccharimonadales bacterium]
MSDQKRPNDPDKNDKKNGELRLPPRTFLVWIGIIAVVSILMLVHSGAETPVEELGSFRDLLDKLTNNPSLIVPGSGRIVYGLQSPDIKRITGRYYAMDHDKKKVEVPFKLETPLTEKKTDLLIDSGEFKAVNNNNLMLSVFLNTFLPFLLILGALYFFIFRQIKMAGKGAMSFGKSRARMMNKEKNKITFKDVAGVEEAKEEVSELVEFLKDPKKFQKLGGRIPKGILMVGAPGTGKTLLAKAIAGEADASFFSISGSDFVEMFVGVGASRVRDMFEQARKNTPCLIFIDEIDAVGRSRGHGWGGGNDEREQTLNALLVEMDGFDTQDGIIIIAATNRPDVLDPALLRPGRFDRQIMVSLPDVRGREAILKVHARNVKLDPSANLAVIARGTPGYSGADLANLLNEAALLAARMNKKSIGMVELEESRIKVRMGRERRSMAMSEEDKKCTAWHEAGHALINVLLEHTHPLHKVTIIPRGQTLGSTMSLPEEDVLNHRRKEMMDLLAVMMAGRIAEEIVSGDISSGAAGDIQQATSIARAMVCQWGMSDKLGMVQYGNDHDQVFMGRDMMQRKDYSEFTAQEIDTEVKRMINESYDRSKSLIEEHRDKLEIIANALLEYESLDGTQVSDIVNTGTFTPPPPAPKVEPPSGAVAATPLPEVPKPVPPKLPGFGSPAPATV